MKLDILRVFNPEMRLIGYVLPQVARFTPPAGVRPSVPFDVHFLWADPDEKALLAIPEGEAPKMTVPIVKGKFMLEDVVFYGPGKYAGAPPDGRIFNLILLEAPPKLWEYPGWIQSQHMVIGCKPKTEMH